MEMSAEDRLAKIIEMCREFERRGLERQMPVGRFDLMQDPQAMHSEGRGYGERTIAKQIREVAEGKRT